MHSSSVWFIYSHSRQLEKMHVFFLPLPPFLIFLCIFNPMSMDPYSSPLLRFQDPCCLSLKHCSVLAGVNKRLAEGRGGGCSKLRLAWRLICRMFKYGHTATIMSICMHIQRQKPWECCQDLWFLSFHKTAPQLLFLHLFLLLRVLSNAITRSEILNDFLVQSCVWNGSH